MRHHDLARYRQPQPGVLPPLLIRLRPVGIKPREDLFEPVLRNTRPLVRHANLDGRPSPLDVNRHDPLLGRKRNRVIDEVRNDLPQPSVMADDDIIGIHKSRLDIQNDGARVARQNVPKRARYIVENGTDIERLHLLPRKFRIQARRTRNIGNQPVQPLDFALNLFNQLGPLFIRFRITH